MIWRWLSALILLSFVAFGTWVWVDNFHDGVDTLELADMGPVDHDSENDEDPDESHVLRSLEAKGAYLARAGNCMACHTQTGGVPYAGGRSFETPFGRVYASNLTPDERTGLGLWNTQHFWRALHHGRSYDGRLLTPVFPYNHTTLITREDADALFAYFISLPPVEQNVPAHNLRWPFGTQAALAVWRTLHFKAGEFKPVREQSDEWNRGAYLVQGLGHCAACHAPRNDMGATSATDDLSGAMMWSAPWYAPSLVDQRQTQLGNASLLDIMRLLQTGRNANHWVTGPMQEVVQHSLQYLSASDLRAMSVYLQTQARQHPKTAWSLTPLPTQTAGSAAFKNGARLYQQHCEQCHGVQGDGLEEAYPALRGNTAVLLTQPVNLIQSVLYGGFSVTTQAQPKPYGMPPFVLTLSDRDIADVLTHIRQSWGNQAAAVSEFEVTRLREQTHR